ncbi:hypothetical protein RRG08_004032 [Elysia crispata]|uniref:Secreted protein n=1 Tax=Elysia crispata TaxID=231223 RepID=A0AAE1AL70_9GAST|nr:hypothetical protein RRG08_004032 [Elysia crispata]
MRMLVSLALGLLVAFCHGQDILNGCDLSQEALTKMGMKCLAHDPSLMLQIMEHIEDPDDMANMKFVCSNQKAIIDVGLCMEKKMITCLPKEAQSIVQSLVVRKRLEAALSLACQHKAELVNQCFDETAQKGFSSCMAMNVQSMVASLGNPQAKTFDFQNLLCRYTAIFKSCLATHNSQCSQSVIDVYDEVFEMMLPEHHCDKQSLEQIKNERASKLLESLLLHGQPMLSNQRNNMGPVYNYKMGRN